MLARIGTCVELIVVSAVGTGQAIAAVNTISNTRLAGVGIKIVGWSAGRAVGG